MASQFGCGIERERKKERERAYFGVKAMVKIFGWRRKVITKMIEDFPSMDFIRSTKRYRTCVLSSDPSRWENLVMLMAFVE